MTEYSLQTDKYPTTIDGAMAALNNAESQLPSHFKRGCGGLGDFTFAQTDGEMVPGTNGKLVEHVTCHKCKKIGHCKNKCPSGQDGSNEENGSDGQVSTHVLYQSHHTSGDHSLNHIQLTMMTATLDREIILLDSQSSVHVLNNKELLTDIRLHPEGKTL